MSSEPAGAATAAPPSENSSRNRRRNDLADREYRANRAPFTTSGRLIRAKTGPSRLVKNGESLSRSSSVNSSATKSKGRSLLGKGRVGRNASAWPGAHPVCQGLGLTLG